jgi:hypothetical protein
MHPVQWLLASQALNNGGPAAPVPGRRVIPVFVKVSIPDSSILLSIIKRVESALTLWREKCSNKSFDCEAVYWF